MQLDPIEIISQGVPIVPELYDRGANVTIAVPGVGD